MNNTTYDDGYIIFVAMLLTAAMISALIVGVCFFRVSFFPGFPESYREKVHKIS